MYSMPLAIGTMAVPTSEIRPRSGMKGKAVHIIHVYEDFLWAMGDKSEPPELESISDDEYEEEEEEEEEQGRDGAAEQDKSRPSEPAQSSDTHDVAQKMQEASIADTKSTAKQLTTNGNWMNQPSSHNI